MQPTEELLLSSIGKHRARGILLDTNVLLLFIFAAFQPTYIGQKRLAKYDATSGKLLVNYVTEFSRILTTPHVLAETSNLAAQIVDGRLRDELFNQLHLLFCLSSPHSFEQCSIKGEEIDRRLFNRIGLTDSCLAALVQKKELLLTDDLSLYSAAVSTGGSAINFTHMREAAGVI
jgi:predicted nucleic acid-binding protein